jgi:tRNA pseudouridine synthase 10
MDYKKIGKKTRESYKLLKNKSEECKLCEGLSNQIDNYTNLIINELKEYDYNTFLIGLQVDNEILENEETLFLNDNFKDCEALKNYLNKEIGLKIESKTDKIVNFPDPDIMIIVNTIFDSIILQIKSLYIYGRYNKLKRGIPQTKWFCRDCKGKGCRNCNYTGKLYETSVEELLTKYFLKETKGTDSAFHGSGREDIDVRMLGNGRPFILEIKNPVKRNIEFNKISKKINTDLKNILVINKIRIAKKEDIACLKDAKYNKIYRVLITYNSQISKEKLKKVALSLRGATINQFTPTRVAKRRANKIRKRKIYNCSVESIKENMATLVIEAESGTYIKELITGDNGKTKPNFSELIGEACTVSALDVLEIKGD